MDDETRARSTWAERLAADRAEFPNDPPWSPRRTGHIIRRTADGYPDRPIILRVLKEAADGMRVAAEKTLEKLKRRAPVHSEGLKRYTP